MPSTAGAPDEPRTGPWLAERLAEVGQPSLLLIDAMERLAPLEDWLRTEFLPTLPRRCVVVIAGRAAPNDRWYTSLDWQGLVQVRRLGGLSRRECLDYLRSRLINGPDADQLASESLGYPLALV